MSAQAATWLQSGLAACGSNRPADDQRAQLKPLQAGAGEGDVVDSEDEVLAKVETSRSAEWELHSGQATELGSASTF